jgi:hypothetical protein
LEKATVSLTRTLTCSYTYRVIPESEVQQAFQRVVLARISTSGPWIGRGLDTRLSVHLPAPTVARHAVRRSGSKSNLGRRITGDDPR